MIIKRQEITSSANTPRGFFPPIRILPVETLEIINAMKHALKILLTFVE